MPDQNNAPAKRYGFAETGTMIFLAPDEASKVYAHTIIDTTAPTENAETIAFIPHSERASTYARVLGSAFDMLAHMQRLIDAWPQYDNDEEINGGDLVDWLGNWRREAKQFMAIARGEIAFLTIDHAMAEAEGWWLSECSNGKYQIRRFDEDPQQRFADDSAAMAHVEARANGGSILHIKALALDGKPFPKT